ncbi:hypothetical protein D9615_001568 [Tricholomella constricta]|uniref:Uncharacterized protein n=1 Tax=Tricholomella constricta TaxID=117010 RepID=A0A8H5HP52_9AGAR|nr:hypothetical protein D9615_001568 [Tricholomella constricta]
MLWSKIAIYSQKYDVTRALKSYILSCILYCNFTMNTLFRPFTRTPAFRNSPLAFRRQIARPILVNSTLLHRRTVASSVSNRPGSQTLEHAATNIKEEVGNSATDLAKVIAGANVAKDSVAPDGSASFLGITSLIAYQVPESALVFGLLGGLPYMASSMITVYLAHTAGMAAMGVDTNIEPGVALTLLDQALNVQVTYGAVMLSFLGALHWGMEFAGYGGYHGYKRLCLGAAPVLFVWPTLAMQPMTALIWQWVGFTGLWYADAKVTSLGWTPKWYSQYRFYLSILVGTCIIGSLAGTSYYGPVAGHGFLSHDLDLIREERKKLLPQTSGYIPGDVEAAPAGENVDHYVRIHHKNRDQDEKAPEAK